MIFSLRSLLQSLTFLLLCSLVATLPVQAETKVLTAEATYIMGDGESPSFAEAMVLQKAKQMALEQAGTYVESYTKIKNYDLTHEEIQTIAGGVLEVEVLEKTRTLVGDGLKFFIKIKATVTTDKMQELAQRIKGKNVVEEYKKLQEDYARLSKEIERWKELIAKTPPGPDREAVLDQIREREKAFTATQRIESTFFQRLVAGEAIVRKALDEKAAIDQLVRTIVENGHVVEVGEAEAKAVSGEARRLRLIVPVTLKLSKTLLQSISDVTRLLGGALEPETEWKRSDSYYAPKAYGSISLVRIGKDLHLSRYFQDRVRDVVLALRFADTDGRLWHCVLSSLQLIFPVTSWSYSEDGAVVIHGWAPSWDLSAYNAGFVGLLLHETAFRVSVMLLKDRVMKLEKITSRFLEKDSEEIRSQLGKDEKPSTRIECKIVP